MAQKRKKATAAKKKATNNKKLTKKELEQFVNFKDVQNNSHNQFNKYSHTVGDIFSLMRDIAVHSNLVFDEQFEAYHLGIIMTERIPSFAE